MGAIAVVQAADGGPRPAAAEAMAAAAPHRGSRIDVLSHGRITLACVTDDLVDACVGVSGTTAVAFVGSLDNADELRSDLAERGVRLHDDTLVTLLAAAAGIHGDDLPRRLRGVFAGAITDGDAVLCFRDHVGYRPLFYRRDGNGFYAASEAKQVVAGAAIPKEPDLEVVERIFYNSTDDDMGAALKGVQRLPKSSCIRSGADIRVWRYWQPETLLETATYSAVDLQDRFDELMSQAVSRCLTGPDILSLSGGIDSPAIAGFAAPIHRQRYGTPLHASTVIYPKYPSVDERRYVEPLAAALDLPLHLYEQEANAIADLDRWVPLTDSPYRSAALAHYAEDYDRARALGMRTVLSGEHAEFVVGLQWYLLDHYLSHGRLRSVRREVRARRAVGRSWPSILRLLARSIAPDAVMDARRALGRTRPSTAPAWVDKRLVSRRGSVPVRERWRRLQLTAFIGPGISLEAEEVCQAVSGVRSRKPWTDIDLWEFFLSLRAEQKFPDLRPKSLVRDLLRGRVPDVILDRQDKTVFDEAGLAEIDYVALRRHVLGTSVAIAGVDYTALRKRLEAEDLGTIDYGWARSLATVHAFLRQWDT